LRKEKRKRQDKKQTMSDFPSKRRRIVSEIPEKVVRFIKKLAFANYPAEEIHKQVLSNFESTESLGYLLKEIENAVSEYRQFQMLTRENDEKYRPNLLDFFKETKEPKEFSKGPAIFAGGATEELTSLIHLLKKHEDLACIYIPEEIVKRKFSHSAFSADWKCSVVHSSNDDDKTQKFNLNISSDLISNLRSCPRRFVIIPLFLNGCKSDDGHANVLIFDKKMNTIERFEPHGATGELSDGLLESYNYPLLDEELEKYFATILPGVKYLSSMMICPRFGLQSIENLEDNRLGDPGGFCAAWSLFYLDARLSNPDIPQPILIDLLLHSLQQQNSEEKTKNSKLIDFIRSYSDNILNKGFELLKQKPKKENKIEENLSFVDILLQEQKEEESEQNLQHYLHDKLFEILSERKSGPIKIYDGAPWDIKRIEESLLQKDEKKENDEYSWEITQKLIEDEKTYQDAAKEIKENIDTAVSLRYKKIIFIGEHRWMKNDDDYGRDLFEKKLIGFPLDKYYLATIDSPSFEFVLNYLFNVDYSCVFSVLVRIEIDKNREEAKKNFNNLLESVSSEKNIIAIKKPLKELFELVARECSEEYTPEIRRRAIKKLKELWKIGFVNLFDFAVKIQLLYQKNAEIAKSQGYKVIEKLKDVQKIWDFVEYKV
jgi:hypothetical protein